MNTWALQDAKSKFSQLIEQALDKGPQIVTKRGKNTAVVISFDDFCHLSKRQGSLVDFFQNSPLAKCDLDIKRSQDFEREIEL